MHRQHTNKEDDLESIAFVYQSNAHLFTWQQDFLIHRGIGIFRAAFAVDETKELPRHVNEQIELVHVPSSQMRQDARANQILANLRVRPPGRKIRQPNSEKLADVRQVLLKVGNGNMTSEKMRIVQEKAYWQNEKQSIIQGTKHQSFDKSDSCDERE